MSLIGGNRQVQTKLNVIKAENGRTVTDTEKRTNEAHELGIGY